MNRRATLSLAAMVLTLNLTFSEPLIVRLDIGCLGWLALVNFAAASTRRTRVQFVARLPVSHADDLVPSSWICTRLLEQRQTPAGLRDVLGMQRHLQQFYSAVSWDELSASHISVTLIYHPLPPPFPHHSPSPLLQVDTPPLPCSIGHIDVCDFCHDYDTAVDCLPPQLMQYLTAIGNVCSRRTPSCPGVVKTQDQLSSSRHSFKLVRCPLSRCVCVSHFTGTRQLAGANAHMLLGVVPVGHHQPRIT
jgi:hypothetical protein